MGPLCWGYGIRQFGDRAVTYCPVGEHLWSLTHAPISRGDVRGEVEMRLEMEAEDADTLRCRTGVELWERGTGRWTEGVGEWVQEIILEEFAQPVSTWDWRSEDEDFWFGVDDGARPGAF